MGLNAAVGEHVRSQILNETKGLVAVDTSVCPFFAVGYHVNL